MELPCEETLEANLDFATRANLDAALCVLAPSSSRPSVAGSVSIVVPTIGFWSRGRGSVGSLVFMSVELNPRVGGQSFTEMPATGNHEDYVTLIMVV